MPQTTTWNGSDTETLPANTRYYYTLSENAGTVLTISLTSSQFDACLILQSPTGKTVVVDDDGGGGTNAFLEVPLEETGNWLVWVTGSPRAGSLPGGVYTVNFTAQTFSPLVTLNYTYYADSSVHTVTDTSSVSALSGRAGPNNVCTTRSTKLPRCSNRAPTPRTKQAALTYYNDGQTNTVVRSVGGTPVEVATSTYTYDGMGRLTGLVHSKGGVTITGYTFSYDAASNMTVMPRPSTARTTTRWTIRTSLPAHPLPTKPTRSIRTATGRIMGYATGAANRLLSDGTFNYVYDKNGNLIRQTRISGSYATDWETDYTWDYENRLTGVTIKNNSGVVQKSIA